ncbi:AAA family ATPase [Rahnella sp. BCC 1045]|uniref:McrB family protein n=1 Tax=Rahnella sp. BCC 1045 TaxID=2816251 RepID=UPI001C255D9B|nr:AAA family ATPase [Rahnella sp. BCC 1045]MBU9822914.1 AAA family ATPase [Rahnella sp. BCC 1045]
MDIIAQIESGTLSLGELINTLAQERDYPHSMWYERYSELTGQVQQAHSFSGAENDELLKALWYERGNGVASIMQGVPSLAEFQKNIPFFRELTEIIRIKQDDTTYKQVTQAMQLAKQEGRLSRMYWSLRNRVFAAFSPNLCTTTVEENAFTAAASFLNKSFNLGLTLDGDWLQKNNEFKQAINQLIPDTDPHFVNMALWHLYELIRDRDNNKEPKFNITHQPVVEREIKRSQPANTTPINQIYFGPPGTGKTYILQQEMNKYTTDVEQADLSAWLDSHLESLNWMQVIALILLDLNKRAKVREIVEHNWFQRKASLNGRTTNLTQTAWASLQAFTQPESTTVEYKNRREPAVFDKTTDSEWFLVKSQLEQIEDLTALHAVLKKGPTSAEAIKRFAVVTFHQSYGYEEFIEGMRARADDSGNVSYPIEPGIFMRLCLKAKADPDHRYAIFIDEINRGNISKIFGELISLIETDKRAGMKNALSLQLSYSGEIFSVPSNVDIIGAMNTADRSLALMDTALRRRFDFIEMMPDLSLLSGCHIKGIDLEPLLENLNSRIEALYDREHTLGHAFFLPVKSALETSGQEEAFKLFKGVFQKKIIPLLQEYFFDDWNKIRLVLADNQKEDSLQFVREKNDDFDALFGRNHGLRRHEQQSTVYELQSFGQAVWDLPQAYREIYQQQEIQATPSGSV